MKTLVAYFSASDVTRTAAEALAADEVDVSAYDAVFIGFPIWWGREPSVIDTFIEAHDFTGKCVIPFCTSGGGGFTNRAQIVARFEPTEDMKNVAKKVMEIL